jgi:hypothetical protein
MRWQSRPARRASPYPEAACRKTYCKKSRSRAGGEICMKIPRSTGRLGSAGRAGLRATKRSQQREALPPAVALAAAETIGAVRAVHAAPEAAVTMALAPTCLFDLARRLGRRVQLGKNSGVRGSGLGRASGHDHGQHARGDGQRNNSIHRNSFPSDRCFDRLAEHRKAAEARARIIFSS